MLHRRILRAALIPLALATAACSQSPTELKRLLEQNPDLIFGVLEKNQTKFIELMQKMQNDMRRIAQEKQQQDAQAQLENDLKNPRKVDFSERAFRGKKDAPIVLIEYSDFQCPFCQKGANTVEELRKKYGEKVVFVFKHLPLSFHPMAMPAAKRFEAIAMQNAEKAYKFHDEVFKNQDKLQGGEKFLDEMAKKIGANMEKMKKDMESTLVKTRIDKDMEEAREAGIRGTPGFVLNGVTIRGAVPIDQFEEILKKRPTFN